MKSSYQVPRISCKHALWEVALCGLWASVFFKQSVQNNLVPTFAESFVEKHSF